MHCHPSAIAQKTPLHFQRMIPPPTRPPSAFMTQKPNTIVLDVANLLGISFNSYVPMSSELWHTYRYGYKNVYVWNGASWVLCLTTGDRQWFKHATISYVPNGSSYATGTTYNWLPPAYGPIHTDFSYLWNNASLMDQEAESNFQRGIYTYVPWYNS